MFRKLKKFYVTTAIDYVNAAPHIGHAYEKICADAIARWRRLNGDDVFFLIGTDENAKKNVEAALAAGMKDIQKYVDQMSAKWQVTWDSLGIINNDFIRTTEVRHKQGVKKFFKKVYENGDIYKGEYEGFYCVECEAFITERDLVDGKCPIHRKEPEKIKEENYFFRLTKYKDDLLEYIKDNPDFIQPETRKNEVLSYIENYLEDISISRPSKGWGIALPIDSTQVIYVWFDALINYLTGLGFGGDDKNFQKYWPADIHLVGKDIIKFHCALWPAMLFSAGLKLPKKIFAHGFLTIDGEKISKSRGNIIDPIEVANKYGIDAVRYFLFREIPFGQDGDFSLERLKERYNGDLANGLGNLTSRVLAIAEKHKIKSMKYKVRNEKFEKEVGETWREYEESLEKLEFHGALGATWQFISFCDGYIEENKPWELAKKDVEKLTRVLYNLLEALRHIAWMIRPFMPETSDKIWEGLGILDLEKKKSLKETQKWGGLKPGTKIIKDEPLFPRI
ncbi:MAG: methionine--tRNA ligase [Parcubacteria group bacterium CG23_combo_of_CG06-09_8_20_14_all_35_9]|nr:MAG: methionine--tRNA ligase [Parcubacteria group bacterium CG23_combo_of_CG06-09_8_20_14_all_35_9]